MPLQGSQIRAIRSPVFRAHWPDKAALFVQADQLLATMGESCSRVAAVWDLLLTPAMNDLALWQWFTTTFPGVSLKAGGGMYPKPTGTTVAMPVVNDVPRRDIVSRAVDVIQSYRKS